MSEFTYQGCDVEATLETTAAFHRMQVSIRVDRGPEFNSNDLELWADLTAVMFRFWRPGKRPPSAACKFGKLQLHPIANGEQPSAAANFLLSRRVAHVNRGNGPARIILDASLHLEGEYP